jgi:hypothetical protein
MLAQRSRFVLGYTPAERWVGIVNSWVLVDDSGENGLEKRPLPARDPGSPLFLH